MRGTTSWKGTRSHFSPNATFAAATQLSPERVRVALRAHSIANLAKQSLARSDPCADVVDSDWVDCTPSAASGGDPSSSCRDLVFSNDPWQHAASQIRKAADDMFVLRPEAAEFRPRALVASSLDRCAEPSATQLEHALRLIGYRTPP